MRQRRSGFTMAEVLTVIAIVVVLAAAAIPGSMGVQRNIKQMQLNRSAETIFMTAQRNLIAAKVSGKTLSGTSVSSDTASDDKDIVLPGNTISPALYNGTWAIAYDKDNWTVTGVTCQEAGSALVGQYGGA